MPETDFLILVTLFIAVLTPFVTIAVSWGLSKGRNDSRDHRIDRLESDLKEIQRFHVTSDELNEVKSDIKEMRKEQTVMFEKLSALLSIFSQRFSDHRTA